jgi:uncharacterized protein (DUF486 family)
MKRSSWWAIFGKKISAILYLNKKVKSAQEITTIHTFKIFSRYEYFECKKLKIAYEYHCIFICFFVAYRETKFTSCLSLT